MRLKTYVMLLASTGLRDTEALSIRLKDLDTSLSNGSTAKLNIRGQYTKTKVGKYVFLTREVTQQLKIWIDYRKQEFTITEYMEPEKKQNELIFSLNQTDNPRPEIMHNNIGAIFAKTLDRIRMDSREDGNEIRRKITLHSFRRFVKTTISDLGYSDYSEWFIGHADSTYWRKKIVKKLKYSRKLNHI